MDKCPRCNDTGYYDPGYPWSEVGDIQCHLCDCLNCRGVGYARISEGCPFEPCNQCDGTGKRYNKKKDLRVSK